MATFLPNSRPRLCMQIRYMDIKKMYWVIVGEVSKSLEVRCAVFAIIGSNQYILVDTFGSVCDNALVN